MADDWEERFRELEKEVLTLRHKVGITKDGTADGNGLTHRVLLLEQFTKMFTFKNLLLTAGSLIASGIAIDQFIQKIRGV